MLSKTLKLFICGLLSLCAISLGLSQNNSHSISGQMQLDSIWERKVYLSHIPNFDKMYTMSRSMIIAESNVDSVGKFEIGINFLPEENQLYRIHVAKKKFSKASIIIGGKEENHFFLIANKSSSIEIFNDNSVFSDIHFLKDDKNKIVDKIDDIVKLIDSTTFYDRRVKSEFVTKAFNEQLKNIADSCSYPLVSLYALQRSKYENTITQDLDLHRTLLSKWENENTPYFENYRATLPNIESKGGTNRMLLYTVIAFLAGITLKIGYDYIRQRQAKPLKKLSIQERKIYILLKEGKSNKEISSSLNIGVNTVKSHVSNIYSKLGVNSRKEIVNL